MAKAQADPVELMQFARSLTRFNRGLEELTGGLKAQLRRLESSWHDQEQQKFVESFDQMTKTLTRFVEESDEHARVLAKKAQHLDNYLKQR